MKAATASGEIEIVPFADLESRREIWTALASRSHNVFASWEWASVWWKHFAANGEPAFAECRRDGGEPFAILPLYVARRGPVGMLRPIGHGPGDVLGPVCDPGDAELTGVALRRALSELPGRRRLLLAERLPVGPLGESLGGRVLQREACPELGIAGRDWDEFLASCSRNMREKLRRNTRKLEREHELSFRLCEDPDAFGAAFDTLLRLHKARWGDEGSAFGTERVAAFHREFGAVALRQGWLRLWTMEVDGEPVAAWYGFRYGEVEAFYQSGRDPGFDRFSIGFLMLMQTIKAAFDDGLARYSFLRGDEPYKDRLADADPGLETRVLGRGALAKSAVWAGSAALGSSRLRRLAARAMR
jgi:CelD/BcsL family acetyltransferase involved in cellulose biosynthesis